MNESIPQENSGGYGKRPVWHWILLYAVIGVIVYGLIYYFVLSKHGGYQTGQYQIPATPTTQSLPTTQPNSTVSTSPSMTSAPTQITIQGNEFAFIPSTITVKMGQPVELTFKNVGKYPHNFSAPDLNIQTKTIQPGQSDTITFTPDKTGSFSFMCTVPTHASRGMTGTLIVQ